MEKFTDTVSRPGTAPPLSRRQVSSRTIQPRRNEAGLLGQGDKAAGGDGTALQVVEAQQGLGRGETALGAVKNGLVPHSKALLGDGQAHQLLQALVLVQPLGDLVVEDHLGLVGAVGKLHRAL